MMRAILIFLITTFTFITASCQDKGKVPQSVLKTFQEMYPNEDDPDFKQDAHGYWEAHFKKDGEKYRADFLADGSWRETENSIKEKNLPKAVKAAIKKHYGDEEITEVEHVLSAKYGEFYDVEFKQKGKNKDVMYRKDGSIIQE
ncbi:PepSY-like domain-containing protein [Nonlabens spongiae]|nr:PepSY-like domain-containing protein [Nonlabens spongiae]